MTHSEQCIHVRVITYELTSELPPWWDLMTQSFHIISVILDVDQDPLLIQAYPYFIARCFFWVLCRELDKSAFFSQLSIMWVHTAYIQASHLIQSQRLTSTTREQSFQAPRGNHSATFPLYQLLTSIWEL